jgi:HD-GYP domain-containing protein (c-di-GMP phosphodiesterase class II)
VHPERGEAILKPIAELRQVGRMVRAHHERYDGNGYPDRLTKIDIPLGARIMSVCDTYDAMTSDRPYRNGLPHSLAVKEIVKNSGSQFDPEIVDHFLALADDFRVKMEADRPPRAT